MLSAKQEGARALAQQLEEQHERRVAHLQQMAARRMMQAGLTKGWQTWLDGWLEQQRHKRMLAAAAGRLLRPKLAAAVVGWREDWQEEQRRVLEEGQRLLRAEAEGRTLQQQAEIDALRAEIAQEKARRETVHPLASPCCTDARARMHMAWCHVVLRTHLNVHVHAHLQERHGEVLHVHTFVYTHAIPHPHPHARLLMHMHICRSGTGRSCMRLRRGWAVRS